MLIEEWFDDYQYEVDYDIGESGMKFRKVDSLNIDMHNCALRYGHHKGSPELREIIANDYEGLTKEQIVVTNGASESIFATVASIVGPRDHIIVEHPNYPSLYEIPRSLNLDMDLFHLDFEDRFKPNLEKLENLFKPNTRLVILSHPNNPTGSIITKEMLCEIVKIAEYHNAYLLFDETYRELSFGDPLPPAVTLSPKAISITSMSKVYGLPGIRIGWMIAEKPIIDRAVAVREQLTISNNAISELITKEVLQKKNEFLKNAKERIAANYRLLQDWMEKQKELEWIPPEGSIVCFPKLLFETSSTDLCRMLVRKYRTFTVPGYCFGMDRHFRIGFGGETGELKIGLNNVTSALNVL